MFTGTTDARPGRPMENLALGGSFRDRTEAGTGHGTSAIL